MLILDIDGAFDDYNEFCELSNLTEDSSLKKEFLVSFGEAVEKKSLIEETNK